MLKIGTHLFTLYFFFFLHFSPEKNGFGNNLRSKSGSFTDSLAAPLEKITYNAVIRQLVNLDRIEKPTKFTSKISFWLIGLTCKEILDNIAIAL